MTDSTDLAARFLSAFHDAASPYLKPEALDYLQINMTNCIAASGPGTTSSDYLVITMTNLREVIASNGGQGLFGGDWGAGEDAFVFGGPAAEALTDIAVDVIGGYVGETEKNLDAARAAWDAFDDFAWFDEGQAQEALSGLF